MGIELPRPGDPPQEILSRLIEILGHHRSILGLVVLLEGWDGGADEGIDVDRARALYRWAFRVVHGHDPHTGE